MKKSFAFLMISILGFSLFLTACSPTTNNKDPEEHPEEEIDSNLLPLTLEALGAGTITITNPVEYKNLKYQKNRGNRIVVPSNESSATINISVGDKICFFAEGPENEDKRFVKINCSVDCYVYGNVMSLLDPEEYSTQKNILKKYAFAYLFSNNEHLKNHNTKKLILPATTLKEGCYQGMFQKCSNLKQSFELPAQNLELFCYEAMFDACSNLETIPEIKAEVLADYCYRYMFRDCVSLKKAPDLPVENLEIGCYSGMFQGCTSLIAAPDLPANTLKQLCYAYIFYDCSNITSIKCLALDVTVPNCMNSWVKGVASSGTFIKEKNSTGWKTDSTSGIPSGWTVQDAE